MSVTQELGKVSITPKGAWSNATAYTFIDVVTNGGSSYLALQDVPTGIDISNTTYWLKIASKGDKGDKGNTGNTGATGATGNGISEITGPSTSGNVDTYTIHFTNGTTTTFTVTNGAVTSVNGQTGAVVLEEVDLAKNLSATIYNVDKEPYGYRTTGGTMDVGEREAKIQLTGGTVAWNQLANPNRSSATTSDYVYTNNGDGSVTVQLLNDVTTAFDVWFVINDSSHKIPMPTGHKFLVWDKNAKPNNINYRNGMNGSNIGWRINEQLSGANGAILFGIRASVGATAGTYNFKPIVVDLTQLFGSTIADYIYSLEQNTAGAGVRWFRKLFPNDYYAYNAGELMSVKALSHKTTGFNQFDKTTAVANERFSATGTSSQTGIYRTDWIRCLPNTKYYFKDVCGGSSDVTPIYWYDSNKNNISGSYISGNSPQSGEFTSPDGAYYMGVNFKQANIDTMCINYSWSGYRNGEYEPYETHSYAFDSDLELRGIPKLDSANRLYYDGDTYTADGTVTRRFAIVDMGAMNWQKVSSTTNVFVSTSASSLKALGNFNLMCSKYPTSTIDSIASMPDKTVKGHGTTGNIYIKDSAFATAWTEDTPATVKTAFSGYYLIYELKTTSAESADPYTETQLCEDYGTEEFIDSRSVAIPVGHITQYPPNLRDKLQHLPNLAEDGVSYLIRQENDYMHLEVYENPLPAAPSENGTYNLRCTVSGSTVTYSWVATS